MQLTACDTLSLGCNGGYVQSAYLYTLENGGLVDEAEYPYVAGQRDRLKRRKEGSDVKKKQTPTCNTSFYNESVISLPLSTSSPFTYLGSDVHDFMAAIQRQPISVLIEANPRIFHHYYSGVITNSPDISSSERCGTNLNHAVLIVGYGIWEDGTLYWKIKNSWGTQWGMDGYGILLRINSHSQNFLSKWFIVYSFL